MSPQYYDLIQSIRLFMGEYEAVMPTIFHMWSVVS